MDSMAQASLEYLMTYGWSLVLIAAVLGVLVFIVSSPASDVTFSSSDPTKVLMKASALTDTKAEIKMQNITGGGIEITGVSLTGGYTACSLNTVNVSEISPSNPVPVMAGGEIFIECTNVTDASGTITIDYTDYADLDRTVVISGKGSLSETGACKTSTVTDFDGNPYNTVPIGEQCWMRENFRGLHNADGSNLNGTGNPSTTPPGADPGATVEEGLLYNWQDAMNGSTSQGAQGICPTGWHVPTDAEWHTLEYYLWDKVTGTCDSERWGPECVPAATELRLCDAGNFCALLAGYRDYGTGEFGGYGNSAYFWTSTEYNPDLSKAWGRGIENPWTQGFHRFNDVKAWGLSVRCIQD